MNRSHLVLIAALAAVWHVQAQTPLRYTGANITGQIVLTRTVNLRAVAKGTTATAKAAAVRSAAAGIPDSVEVNPYVEMRGSVDEGSETAVRKLESRMQTLAASTLAAGSSLGVNTSFTGTGFSALTHRDQKLAYNGNQFNIEPPSPSIAVNGGYVLEGVNNAVQVFSTSGGAPLLDRALASNEVFGLAPACYLNTSYDPPRCLGPFGPYLTDMRVFYDWGINRWFIVQRSLDNNSAGQTLNSSHMYIAVSQTADPTETYNIYVMDTTNASNGPWCPCVSDFPMLGADQYGFYISANEYGLAYSSFVDVAIVGISKKALAAGAAAPSTYRLLVRQSTGYDFTIHPASTPPGASYFLGSNGVEYFVSGLLGGSGGTNIALWALSNTASLDTASPQPALSQILIPTLTYLAPDRVPQRPGSMPYGSTLVPPGQLAYIDAGDSRVHSVTYAGGRVFATLGTQVTDDFGNSVAGGAYFVLSPTFRNGVLSSFTLGQGYLKVNKNHLLCPSVAVNSKGQGAITFTLVGPDYYPSAAILPLTSSVSSQGVLYSIAGMIQISGPGAAPEDGFTGYPNTGYIRTGIARWGDYSTSVAASDGSIWSVAEFIPNAPRTQLANWGTFVSRIVPN